MSSQYVMIAGTGLEPVTLAYGARKFPITTSCANMNPKNQQLRLFNGPIYASKTEVNSCN